VPAVLGFLWAGLAAVAYLIAYRSARARDEGWRVAARSAGLTDLQSSRSFGIRKGLTGRIGPLRVSMERYRTSWLGDTGTRIVIDGLGHPPGEFAVRAEGLGSSVKRVVGEREIELGEEAFDATAYVQGSPRLVRAILDAPTRRLLGDLLDGRVALGGDRNWVGFGRSYPGQTFEPLKARVSVSAGALRADIRDSSDIRQRFHDVFHTILATAQRLVAPEDIPGRLARNVSTDPLPAVRLANLLTLAHECPESPETPEAFRAACRDPDDEVRLRAAVELGEEGWEVLRAIASREDVEDSRAARAVDALGMHLSREQAEAILHRSLRGSRRATAPAAIRALGRIGGPEVVPTLGMLLDEEAEDLAAAAATALGESGEATAEAPLLGALRRDSPDLRVAIAQALGEVGSAAAVAPLRELAAKRPLDRGLGRTSRQAIARIQSRLTGAAPGQLALADADSGRLSLAGEEAHGRLSLPGGASIGRADEAAAGEEEASSSASELPARRTREEE
jgi:HEAT repeat protein